MKYFKIILCYLEVAKLALVLHPWANDVPNVSRRPEKCGLQRNINIKHNSELRVRPSMEEVVLAIGSN